MKKKLLALVLASAMILSLAACGSSSSSSDDASSDTSTSEESADSGSDETTADADVEYDTITLTTATSYNESEFSGSLIAWFGDYLEEKSGGAVTVDCYYGGSFITDAEVYDYVMSGDLNLSFVQPVYAMSYFPYSFGLASSISNENVVETANATLYDNEETAALIEEQGAENNLKLLGHTCAGSSIFLSKVELTSFEDCVGYTIGSPINLEIYESYGMGTVSVEPADMYDSLSRGVCDFVAFSAANALSANLYEVATYIGDPHAYFTNQIVCMNNDVWNSLNEDTQDLIIEAVLAVGEYSIEAVEDLEQELIDKCEEAGGGYVEWSQEDGDGFILTSMQTNCDMLRGYAENLGCEDGMETIIDVWEEGLDIGEF